MRTVLAITCALLLTALSTAAPAAQSSNAAQTAGASVATPQVNINTATAAELEKLPGIGAATAARILEYRTKNGPFKKIEDLMNVRGIGEKTFLTLKPRIVVTPSKGTV